MRVDVRVWWARDAAYDHDNNPETPNRRPNIVADFPAAPLHCSDDDARLRPGGPNEGPLHDQYHAVYLSGSLRVSELRR